MGRSIYFSNKELKALRDTSTEWMDIMGSGDDLEQVQNRLDDGLGSANYKLYCGLNGQRAYTKYVKGGQNE